MDIIEKYTPSGTRDLIYEEAFAEKELENKLYRLYLTLGYKPIETPVLEYYDVFNHEQRYIPDQTIYKFTDNEGKLVALRPDNTSPVVRVALSKLKDESLPLLLCYSQPVFRNNLAFHAKRDQILQCGVELIGGETPETDLRCLFTALQTLNASGSFYKLELGHAGFFDALITDYALSENEIADLRSFISARNSGGYAFTLNMTNPAAVSLARELPRLCGSPDRVLPRARVLAKGRPGAQKILDELETTCSMLTEAGYGTSLILDLGIVQVINYYTGIVFRGYLDGVGEAVLSGGRYDHLLAGFGSDLGACGFGFNISEAAKVNPRQLPPSVPLSFADGVNSLKDAQRVLDRMGKED